MYLLATELTGRRDAGLLAGLIFGFSPARFAQISHLQVLMTGWMPLALWMLHRYLGTKSRRALIAFAVFFTIQGSSNGYYIFFLALAAVIVIAAHVSADPRRGPIDIQLASNQTRRLRLRQVGRTRTWFWSVDELQIWARQ